MLERIARLIIGKRWIILITLLLITSFFFYEIKNVKVYTKFADLLPYSHPYIKTHLKYVEQLGDPLRVSLVLKVKRGDIFNVKSLQKIRDITDSMDAIPGINHNQLYSLGSSKLKKIVVNEEAIITMDIMPELPKTEKEAEALKTIVHRSEGVYGVFVSFDDKATLFNASFIPELMDYNVIYDKVNEIIKKETDSNHVFYAAGEPLLAAAIARYKKEMFLIFSVTGISMLLLLFFYFRNIVGVVVPLAASIFCVIWGLGFVGLLRYNLDPLVLVVPLLITARALSHSVQMTERYFEAYQEMGAVKDAAMKMIISIYPPGLLSIVTDAIGILFIAVAPIPLVQKLAYVSAFWAIGIVMNGMILTPILLTLFTPPRNITDIVDLDRGKIQKILSRMGKLCVGRSAYFTFTLLVGLGIFTGYRALQVKIGDVRPGTPILWPESFYNTSIDQINKNFPGMDELIIIGEGDNPGAIKYPEGLEEIASFQRYMEEDPAVARTFSVVDLIQPYGMYLNLGYPKWETMPDNLVLDATLFYLMTAGSSPGDFDRYMSSDERTANIIVWYKDHKGTTIRSAFDRAKTFINSMKDRDPLKGLRFRLASGNLGILAAVNETIQGAQLVNYVLVMGLTYLLCAITFRSFVAALFLAIPLNLTNFITLAIMSYMKIGLNINTLPIASLGIGIGIDYGIYLLSRVCEEYQSYRDYATAFQVALKTSGKAIFFTATTMAAGTIFWYFISSLRFQAEMGLLLTCIMGINMVMALIMLPTLIFIFKPKFITSLKY